MTENVISLASRRPDPAVFCLSITLTSEGKVDLVMDKDQFQTRAQAAWALSQVALAIADIVAHKNTLPEDHP